MFNNIIKIIVHGGKAHLDDLLSAAIVLCKSRVSDIERRDPTDEEMQDRTVAVLDVGGKFDPDLVNLDHHQRDKHEEPKCTLRLLLEYMGKWDAAKVAIPSLKYINLIDVLGPFAVAKDLGVEPSELLGLYTSPGDKYILEKFEAIGGLRELDDEIIEDLKSLGASIMGAIEKFEEQMEFFDKEVKVLEIGGLKALIIEDANKAFMNEWVNTHHSDAAVSISYDERGEGWTLYRFNDHPRIDFSLLEGEAAILFAHKGGFISKTKERINLESVLELAEKALTPQA